MITPLSLVRAATNMRDRVLEGPLADLRRMPRVAIDTGPGDADDDGAWGVGRSLGLARAGSVSTYRYAVHPTARLRGAPVLLVSPLGACGVAFDLRRGCSLVEHLVGEGRHVYQVDDEDVSDLGQPAAGPADLQRWVDEILPHVVRTVSAHHDGAPVHVVGWSVGGLTSLLAAAAHPDLPVASITALATPFSLELVPEVAPARPLALAAGGPVLVTMQTLLDLLPVPWLLRRLGLGDIDELLTAPLTMLSRLDDRDFLAQLEAVDDLRAIVGQAAPHVGSLFRSMIDGRDLAAGQVPVGPRTVDLSSLRRPVLLVAGESDVVAPPRAVRAGTVVLRGAETGLATVPGGHLGVVCGRAARTTTWPRLCAVLDRYDPPATLEGAATSATNATAGVATTARDAPSYGATGSTGRASRRRSTRRPPPKPASRTRGRE